MYWSLAALKQERLNAYEPNPDVWGSNGHSPEIENKAHPAVILVAEDEALIRLMIASHLRDAGWTVIEARHADEGLAILNTPVKVDLIITDVRMRGSSDGIALAKHAKQQKGSIPVIVISGELREAPPRAIADAYFSKPCDLDAVLTSVEALLKIAKL